MVYDTYSFLVKIGSKDVNNTILTRIGPSFGTNIIIKLDIEI